jgi:hypothetical protein
VGGDRAEDRGAEHERRQLLHARSVDEAAGVVLVDADGGGEHLEEDGCETACTALISGTGNKAYPMISQGSINADPVRPLNVAVDETTKQAMPWNQYTVP